MCLKFDVYLMVMKQVHGKGQFVTPRHTKPFNRSSPKLAWLRPGWHPTCKILQGC